MPEGHIHGPMDKSLLAILSGNGRIGPDCEISQDKQKWNPAHSMADLKMVWVVEIEDGSTFGPFNLLGAPHLLKNTPIKPDGKLTNRDTGISMPSRNLLKSLISDSRVTDKETDVSRKSDVNMSPEIMEQLRKQLMEQKDQYSALGEKGREKIDEICARIDNLQAIKFKQALEERKMANETVKAHKVSPKDKLLTQIDKKVISLAKESSQKDAEYDQLQGSYERLAKEIASLEEHLTKEKSINADLQELYCDAQAEIQDVKKESNVIREELASTQDKLDELSVQHRNLVKSIKREETSHANHAMDAQHATSQLALLKEELEREKANHAETKNSALRLEQALDNKYNELKKIVSENELKFEKERKDSTGIKDENAMLQGLATQSASQLHAAHQELADVKKQHADLLAHIKKTEQEHQLQIEKLQKKADEINKPITAIKEELDREKEQHAQAKATAETRIMEMEIALKQARMVAEASARRVHSLETKRTPTMDAKHKKLVEEEQKLRMRVTELECACKNMEEKHASSSAQLETEKKVLEEKLKAFEQDAGSLADIKKQSDEDKKLLKEERARIETLQKEMDQLHAQLNTAKTSHDDLSAKQKEQEDRRKQAQEEIKQLQSQLNAAQASCNELSIKRQEYEDQQKQAQAEVSKLNDKISGLEAQLKESSEKMLQASESLRKQELQTEEVLKQSAEKEKQLAGELAEAKQKAHDREVSVTQDLEKAKADLDSAIKSRQESEKQVSELKATIDQMQKESGDKYNALQEQSKVQSSELSNQIKTLTEQAAQLKDSEKQLRAQVDQIDKQLVESQKALDAKSKELSENEARGVDLNQKNDTLQAQLTQLQRTAEETEKSWKSASKQIETLERQIDQTQEELESVKSQHEKDIVANNKLTNENARLRNEMDKSSTMLGQASEEITKQQKQYIAQQKQMAENEQRSAKQTADLQKQIQGMFEKERQLSQQLFDISNKYEAAAKEVASIESLSNQLSQHEEEKDSLMKQIAGLQMQVQDMSEKEKELSQQLSDMNNKYEAAARESAVVESVKDKLRQNEEEKDLLVKQIAEMQKQIQDMSEKEKQLSQQFSDMNSKYEAVSRESARDEGVNERLRQYEDEKASIVNQVAEMQKQYRDAMDELKRTKENMIFLAKKIADTKAENIVPEASLPEAIKETLFLRLDEETIYGPISMKELCVWSVECRISPDHEISKDKETWIKAATIKELGMKWMVQIADSSMYGPINIFAVKSLLADGVALKGGKLANVVTQQESSLEKLDEVIICELQKQNEQLQSEVNSHILQIRQLQDDMKKVNEPSSPALPPKSVFKAAALLAQNKKQN